MSRSTAEAAEAAQVRAAQTGGLFDCGGDARDAAVVVIGVPWEPTVSYRRGASQTPGRIARASQQVDLHSELLGRSFGAETALTLREDWLRLNDHACAAAARGDCAAVNAASAQLNAELAADCAALHASGRAAGVLGGDHSAAYGAIAASAAAHGGRSAPGGIGVLHMDAHYDLRAAYQGFAHSHASVMHNVLESVPEVQRLVSVGVRDYSSCERQRAEKDARVQSFRERELRAALYRGRTWADLCGEIIEALPARVHISFDIDGLDPALCPHTGTPVPGGLAFGEAAFLLDAVAASGRRVVGFDLCEVAPNPRDPGDEWDLNVAARLLHQLCALAWLGRSG
ncbi:MAG: arginase family protein [Deltaproteobacteria bacterium]|nr:arginase family protein [Deltaproteobacteria bacterium]